MRNLFILQFSFFSKRFVFLAVAILCWMFSAAQGQYLLDTFQDDTAGLSPNGPEIGTATYGGGPGSYSHLVTNFGGNDLRLRSSDASGSGGLQIAYFPIASANIMQVDFQMRVEGNSILVGANAFVPNLVFATTTTPINIFLYWGNDLELRIRTLGAGVDKTIDLDYTWLFDTDYQVTLFIDLTYDQYWVYIPGVVPGYKYETFGVDVTSLNSLYFASNFNTTGSQVIDDVMINRGWFGEDLIWYVDDSAAGANNGQSWTDAFTRLQDALTVANPGDQVWVAEGTYKPDRGAGYTLGNRSASFALENGVAIYGGFGGTETSLAERDWRAHETILSGEIGNGGITTDNSYHVVYSASNDATASLDGFTISRGYNVGAAYPNYVGAGMLIMSGGEPTVSNCVFTNNTGGSGGGLGAWSSGSPSLFNCIFMANTAPSGAGGGVSLQHSSPVFRSCMILGNSAGTGGGIWTLDNFAAPILTNCVFSGNTSTNGGAIYNSGVGVSPNGFPPRLQNCSLNENSAASSGGGIYNRNGNDVTLNSCILWANSDAGGTDESAQFTDSSGSPTIKYSCIQGWTGGWGGPGNIGNDPLFVDPDGLNDVLGDIDDNLRLQPTSPCIDTGDPDPLLNDTDGTRNDMGAYGGPGAELGGMGVFPGSGFLFTTVGNIPRSEITQDDLNPNLLKGTANVSVPDLGIPIYENAAFAGSLWLHGLFGDLDTDVDYYQVLLGPWDGATPPNPGDPGDWVTLDSTLAKVLYTYNVILGEWEWEYVTVGPQEIGGVEDLYQLTTTGFWSYLDLRIIWNTQNHPDGLYTLTVKAYHENPPGVLTDITALLGDIGEMIIRVDNSPVTAILHNVKYDPGNPYYVPADDGEIKECSIINLADENENLRFTLTASHPNGFLRMFTLDNIWGKNQYGGVIAQEIYSNPPALWNGVTNTEYQSINAPNPPGDLQPWRRCAYQFRLRVWPRTTNGFGYFGHSEFNDHYFLDLPGLLNCSVYDSDNDGFINMIDLSAFAQYWLTDCTIE